MTKTVLLSVITSTMIMAGGDIAPVEPVVVAEVEKDWGEIFGQSRTFYIDRSYTSGPASLTVGNRNSLATGGYIGYKSPDFNGLTFAVAAYGTYGFNIHDIDADAPGGGLSYDPSLYGAGFDNYAFIGQAYVNYKYNNTNIKAGRMRLDTPMAGADDARMLPNLFEVAVLSNTDVENTTLIAAHVFRETIGTFGNVYGTGTNPVTGAPNMLALQSGYGLGLGLPGSSSGSFENMGTIALGEAGIDGTANETAGVSALAAIYTGVEGLKLQAWDYIAWDILNAIYLAGDYTIGVNNDAKVKLSAQYIYESEIGDQFAGKVDTSYIAGKITGIYGDFSAYFAYSTTGSNDDTVTNGGVITPWGGMPAYTQGMVTRHMFLADTDTWKVAGTYKFADLGLKATAYYVEFDVGSLNTYKPGQAWTATEGGFDIQYDVAAVEGLNLRLRANYPRSFAPDLGTGATDWDEYRLIANYNF
jgi:hypothetical protein